MATLRLEQFRELKHEGFPGGETAVMGHHAGAVAFVEPIDARYGAPSFPFGTDAEMNGPALERWCTDRLAGDHYVVAGPWTDLVYCQLRKDAALLQQLFGVPSAKP